MADPRIISFGVPVRTGYDKYQIQFSADRVNWTTLKIASVNLFLVADLAAGNIASVDGVNAVDDDTNNNAQNATTPPMSYRIRHYDSTHTKYGNWLTPFVVPSPEDFIYHIKNELKDPILTGGRALLTDADYLQKIANATAAFERLQPRRTAQEYALTDNVQLYDLPAEWDADFSGINAVEYPLDQDPPQFIPADLTVHDESTWKWRFLRIYPTADESARIYYSAKHARDGSTIPVSYFESVAMWAVGDAAEQLARRHNNFGDFQANAEMVLTDPRVKRWNELAASAKKQAAALWGNAGSGVRTHIPAYDDHGRLPPIIWGP